MPPPTISHLSNEERNLLVVRPFFLRLWTTAEYINGLKAIVLAGFTSALMACALLLTLLVSLSLLIVVQSIQAVFSMISRDVARGSRR